MECSVCLERNDSLSLTDDLTLICPLCQADLTTLADSCVTLDIVTASVQLTMSDYIRDLITSRCEEIGLKLTKVRLDITNEMTKKVAVQRLTQLHQMLGFTDNQTALLKELELGQDDLIHQQEVMARAQQLYDTTRHLITQETDETKMKHHLDCLYHIRTVLDNRKGYGPMLVPPPVQTEVTAYAMSGEETIAQITVQNQVIYRRHYSRIFSIHGETSKLIFEIPFTHTILCFEQHGVWFRLRRSQFTLINVLDDPRCERPVMTFFYNFPSTINLEHAVTLQSIPGESMVVLHQDTKLLVYKQQGKTLTKLWTRDDVPKTTSTISVFPSAILTYAYGTFVAYDLTGQVLFTTKVDDSAFFTESITLNISDGRLHVLVDAMLKSVEYLVYTLVGELVTRRTIDSTDFINITDGYYHSDYSYEIMVNPDTGASYILRSPIED